MVLTPCESQTHSWVATVGNGHGMQVHNARWLFALSGWGGGSGRSCWRTIFIIYMVTCQGFLPPPQQHAHTLVEGSTWCSIIWAISTFKNSPWPRADIPRSWLHDFSWHFKCAHAPQQVWSSADFQKQKEATVLGRGPVMTSADGTYQKKLSEKGPFLNNFGKKRAIPTARATVP